MSSTPQFAYGDTKKPDGCYVQFGREIVPDNDCTPPDKRSDGFWPSKDSNAAGYVEPAKFASEMRKARTRMTRWQNGHWSYVGVRARACCFIVKNGVGTYINIDSPGLWGIESDSGEYLDEVYADEIATVKEIIEAMKNPIYEN